MSASASNFVNNKITLTYYFMIFMKLNGLLFVIMKFANFDSESNFTCFMTDYS